MCLCMALKCLKFPLLCVLHLAINFQETEHCVFTNDKLLMSELRVLHVLTHQIGGANLHQIAGSAVLNIKGHYLGGNFCFPLKGPVLELEAVLTLLLSPSSVWKGPRNSHWGSGFALAFPGWLWSSFPQAGRFSSWEPKGCHKCKKEKASTCSHCQRACDCWLPLLGWHSAFLLPVCVCC